MSRRPGLGKGLGALIPEEPEQTSSPTDGGVMQIAADKIVPNPKQPRTKFDQEELADLAASIIEHGIIQPLIVTKGDREGFYTLIAGERRLQAARIAQLETVPAILREATEREMLLLALIENVQRADLNPIETAEAYNHLSQNFNLTHKEIAELVGKKRPTISNTLSLLEVSARVKQALLDDELTEGHASAIHTLPVQTQNAILDAHLGEYNFNVRQIEQLARHLREIPLESQLSELKVALKKKLYLPQEEKEDTGTAPKAAPPKPAPAMTAELEDVRKRLEEHLESKVALRLDGEGGTISITYYSTEELNRILDKLLKD